MITCRNVLPMNRSRHRRKDDEMVEIAYFCDECSHVFSYEDILKEQDDLQWGHPCFARYKGNILKPGSGRCESYRA